MHLGFSYIGLIFLIMLMIPNLFWTKNQPKDYEKYVHNERKILLLFERVGEVLVTCLLLIFSDFNIQGITAWMIWLIAIYGRNPMLFVATIILGIGHIGIHLNHRKEL